MWTHRTKARKMGAHGQVLPPRGVATMNTHQPDPEQPPSEPAWPSADVPAGRPDAAPARDVKWPAEPGLHSVDSTAPDPWTGGSPLPAEGPPLTDPWTAPPAAPTDPWAEPAAPPPPPAAAAPAWPSPTLGSDQPRPPEPSGHSALPHLPESVYELPGWQPPPVMAPPPAPGMEPPVMPPLPADYAPYLPPAYTQQAPLYGAPPTGFGPSDPAAFELAGPSATQPGPYGTTPGPRTNAPSAAVGPYALSSAPPPELGTGARSGDPRPHFRPDIEGLRAIAILAVLFFHVGLPGFSGGFVGVDVFYVISGFLITGLLLREGQGSGKVDLVGFYARRMRRLLPAALVVIVVTLAMSALVLSPLRLTEVAGDATAAALYVANFHFAIQATDYLSLDAASPLLHYWSLGVEEQFYLVWPLLLLFVARFLSLRALGPLLVVIAAASFGLSLYWTDASQAWAFFSPVTRAWELAAGALLAVGLLRIPRRAPTWLDPIVVLLGLALVAVSIPVISIDTPFPGMVALLPVVGAVLIILGGLRGNTIPGRVLGLAPMRYIGRISYSLYLWHWPLLILIPIAIGVNDLGVRLALAGVSVVVAAISTELIERPFRVSGYLRRRSWTSVQLGLTASVAVGVAGLFMSGAITIPMPGVKPDPVVVELAGVREDMPVSYADGCHLGFPDTKPADCFYGDPDGTRTAVLFGDSHAAQWLPALDAYARANGWRLESHTKSGCSPVLIDFWERRLRRDYRECFKWRDAVTERLREERPDAVFVGSTRDYEMWQDGRALRVRDAYPLWRQGLTDTLSGLSDVAERVVLLAETPYLNFDPIDCLADDRIEHCDPLVSLVVDDTYAAVETEAAAASGADVLSVNELLCPGQTCPLVRDGTVVFRDTNHITASFMTQLAQPIGDLIEGRDPTPLPSASPLVALATTE